MSSQGSSSIPQIMVFRPTLEEMRDFSSYIEYIESCGAHKAGLAKVIPPKEYVPARSYEPVQDIIIPAPISQFVSGSQGLFTQYNIQKKPMTVAEFKVLAESDRYKTPRHTDFDDLERKYWKNITYNSPIYGADISGSVTDTDQHIWNINSLRTILDIVEAKQGIKIEGVNTAYLYFGMWKTTFAWHTEDMDLYSINYLHFGAPKSWYAIPPEHGKRLERLAAGFFPSSFQGCANFLRHKMTLISPHILKQYSIPFNKITQEAGEFMITFPYGYHSGFNHGFNCAESTNFGSVRWIEFGKRATQTLCQCRRDNVKIGMDIFVKEFQPQHYEAWKGGKDIKSLEDCLNHVPEKPKRLAAMQAAEQTCSSPDSYKRKQSVSPAKRPQSGHGRSMYSPKKAEKKPKVPGKRGRPPKQPKGKAKFLLKATPIKMLLFDESKQPKVEHAEKNYDTPPEIDKYTQEEPLPIHSEQEEIPMLDKYPPEVAEEEHRQKKKKKKMKRKDSSDMDDETEKLHRKKKKDKDKKKKKKKEKLMDDLQEEAESMPNVGHEDEFIPENFDDLEEPPHLTIVMTEPELPPPRVERLKVKGHSKPKKRRMDSSSSGREGWGSSNDTEPERKKRRKKRKKEDMGEYNASMHIADDSTDADELAGRSDGSDLSKSTGKGMPFRRHPITKPPKSPLPVAKQEMTSEEDMTSGTEDQSDTWAKPFQGLWINQPFDFEAEKTFNSTAAQYGPKCSVCQLFQPIQWDTNTQPEDTDLQTRIMQLSPSRNLSMRNSSENGSSDEDRTVVCIPEMCYASNPENTESMPVNTNDLIDREGRSVVLQCASCKVAVHASCYGEFEATNQSTGEWQCRRCASGALDSICCLCCIRGGALKPTTDGRWVHMVCAVAVPDVSFENVGLREPVDVTKIRPARMKLRCFYCHSIVRSEKTVGACIQCSIGKCCMSFHVTCATSAGVTMEPADWPFSVYVTCRKHNNSKDQNQNRPLPEIKLGQQVIAKHKNCRYYRADVTDTTQQIYYHVDFDDGSYSDNLFPCDIENYDCDRTGPPAEGSAVQVRWPDGLVYSAQFRGYHTITLYQVTFEDGSSTTVKREDLYIEDESLPKRVRSKLSTATDMRHSIFYSDPIVEDKHRNVYSRYAKPFMAALGSETFRQSSHRSSSRHTASWTVPSPDEEAHHTTEEEVFTDNQLQSPTGYVH
ncbi:lysine-specific demethylase 4A-like [Ptychodera flava]|uniref:lysine-specific demethylase 4A-like n=1 Tax=Ptychodera flava TaxID=63121 RepID=UPI00396AA18B